MDRTNREISRIGRIARQFTGKALRDTGLGLSEYELIHLIRCFPGVNQMEAAEKLGQDKAAIARRVANLEQKDYIKVEQDENDRRSKKLYETEKAGDIHRSCDDTEKFFYEWLFDGIEEKDMEVFLRVLDTVFSRAREERCSDFEKSLAAEEQRHKDNG